MMNSTFLNQNRPLITGMILKDNPDSIRFAVKNSICDGADCLGIQLECLKKEYKTDENYKKFLRPAPDTQYISPITEGVKTREFLMKNLRKSS